MWTVADILCIALPGVCIGEAIDFWTPKGICVNPTGPWIWDGVYMACVPLNNVCVWTGTEAAQLRMMPALGLV